MPNNNHSIFFIIKNKTTLIHLSVIATLTILAYSPIFQADFAGYDDSLYVTGNDWVRYGLNLKSISWAFTHFHSANWHPLTWLSHMLDCELYGMNPLGHHLTNLLLHIANSTLLYIIFVSFTRSRYQPLALALLFALHPLHVESVAWISERKDVLSTFWGLLCILAYYRYTQSLKRQDYSVVLFLFCLSLMSKPMLVTMPILLLIIDIWPLKRNDSKKYWDKIPLFIPVIASCVVTYIAQLKDQAVNPLTSLSLSSRILNASISSIEYLKKTIWPVNLSVLYPHPGNTINIQDAVICAVIIFILLAFCMWKFRKYPFILTGYLWFFVALSPVIGIVQVGSQSMADRYTYVPHIGLFWAFTWMIGSMATKQYMKIGIILFYCMTIIGFSAKTYHQTHFWKNGKTLFTQAIANTEKNYIAHNNLGVCLFQRQQPEEALLHFNKSIDIEPNCIEARINKAECLLSMNNTQEAIKEYQQILEISPKSVKAHLGLADYYKKDKQFYIAIDHCKKALTLASIKWPIWVKIATIYEEMGELSKTASFYQQALMEHPISPITHYHFARILVSLQKYPEAIFHYKKAIEYNPEFAQAYNSLGALYAWNQQISLAYQYISIARKLSPNDIEISNNFYKVKKLLSQ